MTFLDKVREIASEKIIEMPDIMMPTTEYVGLFEGEGQVSLYNYISVLRGRLNTRTFPDELVIFFFQYCLADVLLAIVDKRRGDAAASLKNFALELRTASDIRSISNLGNHYYSSLSAPYDQIPYILRSHVILEELYRRFTAPWSGGIQPANVEEFVDGILLSLSLRTGMSEDLLRTLPIKEEEFYLQRGKKKFKVNLATLTLEAVPYPLPQPGETWQDAKKNKYIIAEGDLAIELASGAVHQLTEGTLPRTVLGETFFQVIVV